MQMHLSPRLALALTLLFAGAAAQAQGMQDNQMAVTVSANIAAMCRIANGGTSLHMDIDPSSTGPFSNVTEVAFHCTKGTAFDVYINGERANGTVVGLTLKPTSTQGTAGAEAIGYSLSTRAEGNTGRGFGAQATVSVALTASVTPAQYANAAAGDYEDTVVVEIRP
jgi:spore coat protein U-like protein